jgi:hypothetical protein
VLKRLQRFNHDAPFALVLLTQENFVNPRGVEYCRVKNRVISQEAFVGQLGRNR